MCFLIMQQEGREPCQAISYYQMLTDLIGTVRYPMNLVQKKGWGRYKLWQIKEHRGLCRNRSCYIICIIFTTKKIGRSWSICSHLYCKQEAQAIQLSQLNQKGLAQTHENIKELQLLCQTVDKFVTLVDLKGGGVLMCENLWWSTSRHEKREHSLCAAMPQFLSTCGPAD